MKTALSLMFALVTTTALTEPPPVPKPPGPGGSCPHGYITSGSFCTPSSGTQETIAKPPAHAPCAAADDRLELLASLRALRAAGLMIAHGFTVEQMVEIVRAGLVRRRRAIAMGAGWSGLRAMETWYHPSIA